MRHATHVRKRSEFERIQGTGERVNTERFVLIVARQIEPSGAARLGITASRRIGGAIARNRAKRLVREAFRALPELFPTGIDMVVIVRKPLGARRLDAVVSEWRGSAPSLARRVSALLAHEAAGTNTPA